MKMVMEDLKAIEDRLVARQHDLDRIFAQARTQGAMPIGGVSQLMDIIADMKIDLAAITIVPPGLRARIYAWLKGYHRELAGSIGQSVLTSSRSRSGATAIAKALGIHIAMLAASYRSYRRHAMVTRRTPISAVKVAADASVNPQSIVGLALCGRLMPRALRIITFARSGLHEALSM
jgi:hypothetical protein